MAMDLNYLIHKFINEVIMPLVLVSLCIILIPFFIIKFMLTIVIQVFSESMKGKVVLITGASSGIGEQLAYEYAKKGASLVIVARRESHLRRVAERARGLGSPDVLPLCADVSNASDCKRFVEQAINHFGRLDHLVNNAGIICFCRVEDATDVTNFKPVMDVNFWGYVYPTYYAIPHLKKTKGKIVVNSSSSGLLHPPRLSFYAASKAAVISFYEALRVELHPGITITIATLGFVESEITIQGKHLSKEGQMEVINTEMKDAVVHILPVMSSRTCAKTIVDGACRGERYVTEPNWYRVFFMLRNMCPELVEWYYSTFYYTNTRSSISESEVNAASSCNPASIPFPPSQARAD